ncbi:MAG: GNAT family N-acetyltransferase [Ruminococcus sp.]|nr:GNAT family N-acetyltransferase [Ruminococcus sp.]
MIIRPFDPGRDFSLIASSVTDERTHALWSAKRFPYPPERESFESFLQSEREQFGTEAFIAEKDGRAAGFFCLSYNKESGEAMLKFILVDGSLRGQGIGAEMLRLAADYAFKELKARAVQLMVFSVNEAAVRCYTKAGFRERSRAAGAFEYKSEKWDRCNMVRYNEVMT